MTKTILVAEDDENDFLLLERAFSRTAGKVSLIRVPDGAEAIDYLSGVNGYDDRAKFPLPDFVFLDVKMPKVDGFEVLTWIRAQEHLRTLFVMMFSSSTYTIDVQRAYNAGANCYVSKPTDYESLDKLVQDFRNFWMSWPQYIPAGKI